MSEQATLILAGGHVICPASDHDGPGDVVIAGDKIVGITAAGQAKAEGARVVDCAGKLVMPGLIDLHVHFRDPGYTFKEDLFSGAAAALAGGFTSVCCMANTNPVNDNALITKHIVEHARQTDCKIYPIGAISKGLEGEELAEIGKMRDAGAVAVSDDGNPVMNAALMRDAMNYAGPLGIPVVDHCENIDISFRAGINHGAVSARLGLTAYPNVAEDVMVARDIELAADTGAHFHCAHISTAGSVGLIRAAKQRGLNVTAEACVHHLTLTEENVDGFNSNAKISPPLRTESDVNYLIGGLIDGTIDAIITDHAPHSEQEKAQEFELCPNGIIGLETALPLMYGLVKDGRLSMCRVVEAMTIGPARVFGLPGGTLEAGAVADVCIFDPEQTWTVDAKGFKSRSENSPWVGQELTGRVTAVVSSGKYLPQIDT